MEVAPWEKESSLPTDIRERYEGNTSEARVQSPLTEMERCTLQEEREDPHGYFARFKIVSCAITTTTTAALILVVT